MTRCIITVKMQDGYHSVHVYSDGYPDGTGLALAALYRSRESAESIVCNKKNGYAFLLLDGVEPIESEGDSRIGGTFLRKRIPREGYIDYHYIWSDKRRKWLYREWGRGIFQPLCNDKAFVKFYDLWRKSQEKISTARPEPC